MKRILSILFSIGLAAFLSTCYNVEKAAATGGGTIKGKVTYGGAVPARQKIEITKDVKTCGKVAHYKEDLVVSGKNKGLANVVVSVSGIQKGKSVEVLGDEIELDQNGCLFIPHVALVPVGAKLKIKNSDGILHNIHTRSEKNRPFNKAQPRFRKVMAVTFDKPEIIQVSCDVHGWMQAYIVVVEHPYYAVTDAAGNFELTEVPAGTYTLEYWHETLGKQTREISVTAGGTAEANFKFPAAVSGKAKE
ncbi:MAG: carboxypeptidase regulatory-like domain-containing protein [bacterium]